MSSPGVRLAAAHPASVVGLVRGLRGFASLPAVDVRRLARDERADLTAFLATLSPQQWQAPTLCAGWRVRDVVAHVISYDELDARGLLAHLVQGRFRPARVNAVALAGYGTRSPEQLLALLADHGLFRRSGATGARYGRGAADDHRWPTRCGRRTIWPGPSQARGPHRRLTTASAFHSRPTATCRRNRP